MARLLLTVWPFPTHLHPFMALAHAARLRGHQVAFYSGGKGVATLAREGLQCFPFCEVDWGRVTQTVDTLIAERRNPARLRHLWSQFLVETIPAQVRDLEEVLAHWPADAVICDLAMWAPLLVMHERHGIQVVPFSHLANCILPGLEHPLAGLGLPRARPGIQGLMAHLAVRAVQLVTAHTWSTANAVRRTYGLAPLRMSVTSFSATLPLYLVPSAPEFDEHRRDLPPSVHYVGPCLWDKHRGQAAPAWTKEIPSDRPCVVVDEGALYTREPRVLELAARGLAGLPLTTILLAGHGRDMESLDVGPLASNTLLTPHAPLSDVLSRAQVFVTNGNSESVLAAVLAGLPMVVLPSIWDQAALARRVEETGVGLRLSSRSCTPERLQWAVQRVLHEPSFRANAAAMGTALARRGGPTCAVHLIEELLQQKSPPATTFILSTYKR
jgi:MGT family glycosyltransferase